MALLALVEFVEVLVGVGNVEFVGMGHSYSPHPTLVPHRLALQINFVGQPHPLPEFDDAAAVHNQIYLGLQQPK